MTVPTILPIRSRIRSAAIYGVENRILSGGTAIRYSDAGNTTVRDVGYYYTFSKAYDPPVEIDVMRDFPQCNVFMEDEVCSNVDNVQQDQNESKLHNSFMLVFDCVSTDVNDPALVQDKMLHDIQVYFGINYYIPDSAGVKTAFNCYYAGSSPWSTSGNKPRTGITVRYQVWYRQFLSNPATTG